MNNSQTQFEKFKSAIADNPVVAAVMVLGAIIIALSSFTDATKNLLSLFASDQRATINGVWQAQVSYPARDESYSEVFQFEGDNTQVQGTASYLEKEQVIVDGAVNDNSVTFTTKTVEYAPQWNNSQTKIATHLYHGKLVDDQIVFVLQTTGGYSANPPLRFTAHRQ
jgi:hypothetical protein